MRRPAKWLQVIVFMAAVGLMLFLLRSTVDAPTSATQTHSPITATSTPSTSTTTTSSPSTTATAGDDVSPTTVPGRDWLTHVEDFVKVFTAADTMTPQVWHDRLAALATPALGDGLRLTDPANAPTGKIVSSRVVTDYDDGGGIVRVRLDSGPILLVTVVVDGAGRPLIANIEPQR